MIEIKFRSWNVEEKIMHDFAVPSWNGIHEVWADNIPQSKIDWLSHGPEREGILMQYTGLKDRNGKEIYEGDLMRAYKPNSYCDGKDVLEVRWRESEAAFRYWCFRMNNWEGSFQSKQYNIGNNKSGAWCEVIGNIYQNPELIK